MTRLYYCYVQCGWSWPFIHTLLSSCCVWPGCSGMVYRGFKNHIHESAYPMFVLDGYISRVCVVVRPQPYHLYGVAETRCNLGCIAACIAVVHSYVGRDDHYMDRGSGWMAAGGCHVTLQTSTSSSSIAIQPPTHAAVHGFCLEKYIRRPKTM